jgi:hypothetical protein
MGAHIACQFPDEGVAALVEDGAGVGSALGSPDRGASAESLACSTSSCASCASSLSNGGDWSLEAIGEAGDEARELLLGGLDMDIERGSLGMSRILAKANDESMCASCKIAPCTVHAYHSLDHNTVPYPYHTIGGRGLSKDG